VRWEKFAALLWGEAVTRSALLLFMLPALVFAASANDPPAATYRTTVSEVRVTFFTTDENNHPVDTVRKDDFAIVDSSMVVREFRSLSRSDETALDVVVVVDASESVAPRFQATMNEVLQLVFQRQVTTDDNLSVVSFGGRQPAVICARNCRSQDAGRRLLAMKAAGATPLYDALAYGANFISGRRTPGVRPVLILFSDGNDTISKTSAPDALQAVVASGTLLYAVDMNKPGDASSGSAALQQMADETGGRYFSFREGAANVLQTALKDLRASYVVTYQVPTPAVGFHSLRILPKHNLNLRFHSRSGYYYEPDVP
jgi:VWFA-related protein